MAKWMRAKETGQFGTAEIKKNVTSSDYKGRQGIAFFKDFWTRSGQTHPTGDHIDLWDGSKTTKGAASYFDRSVQVWFWDIA